MSSIRLIRLTSSSKCTPARVFKRTTQCSAQRDKAAQIDAQDSPADSKTQSSINSNIEQAKNKLKSMRGRKPLANSASQKLNVRSNERAVPSTKISRMVNYGSLVASLGADAISEKVKKQLKLDGGLPDTRSVFLTEKQINKIVDTLCNVRGAALKLGQMLSIADIKDNPMFPKDLAKIFDRVRQGADYMPKWQMESVLVQELGQNWQTKMKSFDSKPFAAASIGQVHQCVTHDGRVCAMKVQYPGVAESINSDIDTLLSILIFSKLLPDGLFIEEAATVARRELNWEVDYVREAECATKFKQLLANDDDFFVPEVIPELSTKRVITSEMIQGVPLDQVTGLSQSKRDQIAEKLLNLCLRELFEFHFMQTDPNWSNFFYDEATDKICLLDFGASIGYKKSFVDTYIRVIHGAAMRDSQIVERQLKELGFITGYELKHVKDAHVNAVMALGEPFANNANFDFGNQRITNDVIHLAPDLVHRLTPPPEEIYSLHRKMAGAFLLCAKLGANINCHPLFQNLWNDYKFSDVQEA